MSGIDPEGLVREAVRGGLSLDEIATKLREADVSPTAAVKALRNGAGVPLGEGKFIVDRSLPPAWQAANERLRDAAVEAILDEAED